MQLYRHRGRFDEITVVLSYQVRAYPLVTAIIVLSIDMVQAGLPAGGIPSKNAVDGFGTQPIAAARIQSLDTL